MTLGQRIKNRRLELGIKSQRELAEKVGMDTSNLSLLESGKGHSTMHIAELAHALKVNALWLKTGKGKPDLDYIPPVEIEKKYSEKIEEIIKLMEATDDRGQEKILLSAKDTLDAHKAFQNSLLSTTNKQVDEMAALVHRLGTKALAEIMENEKLPSEEYTHVQREARKDKPH